MDSNKNDRQRDRNKAVKLIQVLSPQLLKQMKLLTMLLGATLIADPATTTKSFWVATKPTVIAANDSDSVNVGIKFKVLVPGLLTAIKFYKSVDNVGPHKVVVWQGSSQMINPITATNETTDGWQTVKLSFPIRLYAEQEYTASYLAPNGHYSDDQRYNWLALKANPLVIAENSPGVFAYSNDIKYPSYTWNGSNYWVDVVFKPYPIVPHTVSLSWRASTSKNVVNYNIYRSVGNGFNLIGASAKLTYLDKNVISGNAYYYVATAVDNHGNESLYSNEAIAVIPIP